jgi:hypothetical protein
MYPDSKSSVLVQITMFHFLCLLLVHCFPLKQIGTGNFSCAFKVLKRIDGCLYAVKHSTRQLHQEAER